MSEDTKRHCGNEKCLGQSCENWPKCRGETIPPWDCGPHKTTAERSFREQDILKAADELADMVEAYLKEDQVVCPMFLKDAIGAYRAARNGKAEEKE